MKYLGVDPFEVVLHRVHWAPQTCRLIFFIKFEKFQTMISQHPFNPFSLSFPSETPITHILVPSVVFHLSLKLCSYWMLGHAFKAQAGNFQFCLFNYLCRTSESARGKSLSASKIFPRYAYHSYIQRVLKILSRHPFFEFFFQLFGQLPFCPNLQCYPQIYSFFLLLYYFFRVDFEGERQQPVLVCHHVEINLMLPHM